MSHTDRPDAECSALRESLSDRRAGDRVHMRDAQALQALRHQGMAIGLSQCRFPLSTTFEAARQLTEIELFGPEHHPPGYLVTVGFGHNPQDLVGQLGDRRLPENRSDRQIHIKHGPDPSYHLGCA